MRARDCQCHFFTLHWHRKISSPALASADGSCEFVLDIQRKKRSRVYGRGPGHAEVMLNESGAQPVQWAAGELTAKHSW